MNTINIYISPDIGTNKYTKLSIKLKAIFAAAQGPLDKLVFGTFYKTMYSLID